MRLVGSLCVSAAVAVAETRHVQNASSRTNAAQDPTNHNSRITGVTGQVGRIIPLLEGLGQEIADQFKLDTEIYDKKSCAFEETIEQARKTRADLMAEIDALTKAIEQNQADIGALKARVASAQKKQATLQEELAEAQDNREKEHTEYAGVVATLNQDIGLLHDAFTVLDDFLNKGFAQVASSSSAAVHKKDQKAIWSTVRDTLQTLPLGRKGGLSAADVAKMEGFLDTDVDMSTGKIVMGAGAGKASLLQAPMSSEGQGILGILKQMRGQSIAELQGRQEIEQATAAKFAVYVEQTNTKLEFLQNEEAKLEEQLAARKAMLSENTERQGAARTELSETEKLLEETVAASKALAKAHAELSEVHTSEMNGLAKAIEILSGQQTIHKGLLLVQTAGATVQKNVHIEDTFYKINVAIKKKIKSLNGQLQGLKDEEEACKEQLATIAAVGASQEAMQNTLKTKIAATQAEIDTLTKERNDLEKKVGETEVAVKAGQDKFEAGDAAREKELDELVQSKKAIAAALQALHDAESENSTFGQAIAILQMIAAECDTGIKDVTGIKADEMKEWGEQKTSQLNLIREMETQIQTLDHDLTRGNAKKTKQKAALKASEEQGAPDPAECEAFLAAYSGEVTERENKITQLKDASSALLNWQNFSADNGAASSKTLGGMKTAEEIEAEMA